MNRSKNTRKLAQPQTKRAKKDKEMTKENASNKDTSSSKELKPDFSHLPGTFPIEKKEPKKISSPKTTHSPSSENLSLQSSVMESEASNERLDLIEIDNSNSLLFDHSESIPSQEGSESIFSESTQDLEHDENHEDDHDDEDIGGPITGNPINLDAILPELSRHFPEINLNNPLTTNTQQGMSDFFRTFLARDRPSNEMYQQYLNQILPDNFQGFLKKLDVENEQQLLDNLNEISDHFLIGVKNVEVAIWPSLGLFIRKILILMKYGTLKPKQNIGSTYNTNFDIILASTRMLINIVNSCPPSAFNILNTTNNLVPQSPISEEIPTDQSLNVIHIIESKFHDIEVIDLIELCIELVEKLIKSLFSHETVASELGMSARRLHGQTLRKETIINTINDIIDVSLLINPLNYSDFFTNLTKKTLLTVLTNISIHVAQYSSDKPGNVLKLIEVSILQFDTFKSFNDKNVIENILNIYFNMFDGLNTLLENGNYATQVDLTDLVNAITTSLLPNIVRLMNHNDCSFVNVVESDIKENISQTGKIIKIIFQLLFLDNHTLTNFILSMNYFNFLTTSFSYFLSNKKVDKIEDILCPLDQLLSSNKTFIQHNDIREIMASSLVPLWPSLLIRGYYSFSSKLQSLSFNLLSSLLFNFPTDIDYKELKLVTLSSNVCALDIEELDSINLKLIQWMANIDYDFFVPQLSRNGVLFWLSGISTATITSLDPDTIDAIIQKKISDYIGNDDRAKILFEIFQKFHGIKYPKSVKKMWSNICYVNQMSFSDKFFDLKNLLLNFISPPSSCISYHTYYSDSIKRLFMCFSPDTFDHIRVFEIQYSGIIYYLDSFLNTSLSQLWKIPIEERKQIIVDLMQDQEFDILGVWKSFIGFVDPPFTNDIIQKPSVLQNLRFDSKIVVHLIQVGETERRISRRAFLYMSMEGFKSHISLDMTVSKDYLKLCYLDEGGFVELDGKWTFFTYLANIWITKNRNWNINEPFIIYYAKRPTEMNIKTHTDVFDPILPTSEWSITNFLYQQSCLNTPLNDTNWSLNGALDKSVLYFMTQNPIRTFSYSLPPQLHKLILDFSWALGFDTKLIYFYTQMVDKRRSFMLAKHPLFKLFNLDSQSAEFVNKGYGLQKQKLKINRLERYDYNYLTLIFNKVHQHKVMEIEFIDEVGTGLGPTLEFYSICWYSISTNYYLWYYPNSIDLSTRTTNSLYPMPLQDTVQNLESKAKFYVQNHLMIGKLIARAILDFRFCDIDLNVFFLYRLKNPNFKISILDDQFDLSYLSMLTVVDNALATSLLKIYEMKQNGQTKMIDELGLYFVCPFNPKFLLVKKGDTKPLTSDNVYYYLNLVIDTYLGSGIDYAIKAWRDGFFDIVGNQDQFMTLFSVYELDDWFRSDDHNLQNWDIENLKSNIKLDHGYSSFDTPIIKNFISLLEGLDVEHKKLFIKFLTGATKLPMGGWKNLNPQFTIVKRICHNGLNDQYLPSVMTCANYLKLPDYSSLEVLTEMFMKAITEGQNCFHLS